MSSLVLAEQQSALLASLRRLDGRATVGDLIADSGLPGDAVRAGVKALLASHEGHLAVSDSGELVYEFDPRFIERGTEPWLARAWSRLGRVVRGGFKAVIVTMLVGYFVAFVALVIAALVASQRGGDDSRGGWGGRGGGRGHRGGLPFDPLIWYWIWGPRWRIGRPYYGHRWERTLEKADRVPFYKKVFAFVFGPDKPDPTQAQLDRGVLRLIRARKGVLTTAELVQHSGVTVPEAEEEMGRLLGSYDGEAVVSPDGEVVYAFPGVMTSVGERRAVREPNPAWLRLEYPRELTGNTPGANALVVGMNTFTLAAAATAPFFIFPRLGLGGTAAWVGLVLVPVIYSVLFFAGPLVRMVGVKLENRRRAQRNVRRVVLGLVYDRSLRGGAVGSKEACDFVTSRLPDQAVPASQVTDVLRDLAAEFEADVEADEAGELTFTFPVIRNQFAAGDAVRTSLRLDEREVGEIVFATGDSPEAADERDARLFDRALSGDSRLERYLPPVDRVDFEDDYEVVAFEEQLAQRGRGRDS